MPVRSRERLLRESGASLRFVVKTKQAVAAAELRDALRPHLGPRCKVESLFPGAPQDDPNEMPTYYLATIPHVTDGDLQSHAFDIAYGLVAKIGIVARARPDLPHSLYAGPASSGGSKNCGEVPSYADRAWSLRQICLPEGWDHEPTKGRDIVVGHVDTGIAPSHEVEDDQKLLPGRDVMRDVDDGTDPLIQGAPPWVVGGSLPLPQDNPGHGTATASVLVSRGKVIDAALGGTEADGAHTGVFVTGVAPGARVRPVRVTRTVVSILDGNLVKGIYWAVRNGCHVITISLGGVPNLDLKAATDHAAKENVIVCAAAGQCVPWVVAPAQFDEVVGVTGTINSSPPEPWEAASHGGKWVSIAAPAQGVWTARRAHVDDELYEAGEGSGTSFATPAVAGAAALWLARHARNFLINMYRGHASLTTVFEYLLRRTATKPAGWDEDKWGPGVLNVCDLLDADLPDALMFEDFAEALGFESAQALRSHHRSSAERLLWPLPPDEVARRLAEMLQVAPEALDAELDRVGDELIRLIMENRDVHRALASEVTTTTQAATQGAQAVVDYASRTLGEVVGWAQAQIP